MGGSTVTDPALSLCKALLSVTQRAESFEKALPTPAPCRPMSEFCCVP